MNIKDGIALGVADLIHIWIGVAVSVSAIFAWLSWRLGFNAFLLNVPHIEIQQYDANDPRLIRFRLEGIGMDQWKVDEVRLVKPRRASLIMAKDSDKFDSAGSMLQDKIAGKKIDGPPNAFYISLSDCPVVLRLSCLSGLRPR